LTVFFAHLGSSQAKAAHKALMKLTTGRVVDLPSGTKTLNFKNKK